MGKLETYKTFGFVLLAVSTGCAVLGPADSKRGPASFERLAKILYPPVPSEVDSRDLSFSELEEILKRNKFEKISDLLKYLSKHKSEYLSHYTLAHSSFSLHGSSASHPRAIVYGKRGNFIISFNGERNQRGYNLLEVVEFNHKTKKFEFREIQFKEDHSEVGAPYQISNVDGPEGKCLQCHTNRRPIWETYPLWPGLYGADDDFPMGVTANGSALKLKEEDMDHNRREWLELVSAFPAMDRYKYLPELTESEIFTGGGKRPNADLGANLVKLNMERIAREIKEHSSRDFRFAYLFAARCSLDPQFSSARGIQKLIQKHGKKMDATSFHHQVYRLSRILTEQRYDLMLVQKAFGFSPVAIRNGKDQEVLVQKILRSPNFNVAYKIADNFKAMVAITEEFFPEAKPHTWPSAIYEGVHRYSSGTVQENLWLFDSLKAELFSGEEIKELEDLEEKNKICNVLKKNLPKALK